MCTAKGLIIREEEEMEWENKSECNGKFTSWVSFKKKQGKKVSGAWNDNAANDVLRARFHSHFESLSFCLLYLGSNYKSQKDVPHPLKALNGCLPL